MEKYIGNIKIRSFESKVYGKTMYDLSKKDEHGDMMPIGKFHNTLISAQKEASNILDEINS